MPFRHFSPQKMHSGVYLEILIIIFGQRLKAYSKLCVSFSVDLCTIFFVICLQIDSLSQRTSPLFADYINVFFDNLSKIRQRVAPTNSIHKTAEPQVDAFGIPIPICVRRKRDKVLLSDCDKRQNWHFLFQ